MIVNELHLRVKQEQSQDRRFCGLADSSSLRSLFTKYYRAMAPLFAVGDRNLVFSLKIATSWSEPKLLMG
jgi:hypothetical protein